MSAHTHAHTRTANTLTNTRTLAQARLLRVATKECEQQCDMADEPDFIQLHCVRSCVAQDCYNELYGADPVR